MKIILIILFWVLMIKYYGPIAKQRMDIYHERLKP